MPHDPKKSLTPADFISQLRLSKSFNPVPYSAGAGSDLPDVLPAPPGASKKITVVGCGAVGMAIAYSLLNQSTAGTIALVDVVADRLEGEAKDLEQGSAFHPHTKIVHGTDYVVSKDSDLVIITAGAAQRPGESRLDLVGRNVKIMSFIMPPVLKYSPDAAICVVANPCDILTAVACKMAGPSVPPGRIFGSGTNLDSSRLRNLIATTLECDTRSVHGYVIGEHGDSSVPVWSSVNIGGVHVLGNGELPGAIHNKMHKEVVESAGDVIVKKGNTNWAVGQAVAHIATAVVRDQRMVIPVSTCVRGFKGVTNDVCLSLPCSVGAHGVRRVFDIPLNEVELAAFQKSAETLWNIQKEFWDTL